MIIQNLLGMHGKGSKMWMECGNDECEVWMPIKVPGGWSVEHEEFMCGVCMVRDDEIKKVK